MLNMLSAAAILAFLGLASALPQKPGAQIPAKRAVPDNIAAIMSVDPSTFTSYQTGGLIRSGAPGSISNSTIDKRCPTNANGDCCQTTSQYDVGENDGGGWGITLQNGANVWEGFYFYENSCDSTPYKYTWVGPNSQVFITLPWNFQGRMTRGTDAMNLNGSPNLLGTWFEFNWHDGAAWGDISLIQGCDQGMLMWSMDGSGAWKGFTQDILANAPVGAWAQKPDGHWCLAPNEGPTADPITTQYELDVVGAGNAYINDAYGNPVISSSNGRFGVFADPGLI